MKRTGCARPGWKNATSAPDQRVLEHRFPLGPAVGATPAARQTALMFQNRVTTIVELNGDQKMILGAEQNELKLLKLLCYRFAKSSATNRTF